MGRSTYWQGTCHNRPVDQPGEWEALLQVIQGVSTVDDVDQFGAVVLDEIDRLVPCDLSSFNEVDPIAGRAVVVGRPRPISPEQLQAWEKWSHQNPSLMYVLSTGDGSARRISDFLTRDEFHRLELYQHVYEPLGLEYQLSVALPTAQPLVIGIALNRADRDFSDEEVGLLDALRPHLVQAHRHVQLVNQHRRALERMAGILEEDGRAFQVLGEPLTERTRALFHRYFGAANGDLPQPVSTWLEDERAAFPAGGPDRLRQPLVAQREGCRLTVRYVPGGRGPDLLWLVERQAERDAGPLERLGLSPREAETLWLLCQGRSTGAIAHELSISTGTVKKHLEHVYRKLGVSTATAAVAQAFDALTA